MKIKSIVGLLFLVILFSCKDEPENITYSKVITEFEYNGIISNGDTVKGQLLYKYIYKYDLNGNLEDEQSFDSEGKMETKTLYTYSSGGYEGSLYNSKNVLLNKYEATYNAKGQTSELNVYSPQDVLLSQIIYTYDSSDFLTGQTVNYYSDADSFVYFLKYINDENGNALEVLNYGSGDTVKSRTTNKYLKFNQAGDWLIRRTVLDNGTIRISERDIEIN